MSDAPLLIPNVAAEEGPGWRRLAAEPAVRAVVACWRLLFEADAEVLDEPAAPGWPSDIGAAPEAPVFPWLEARGAARAWLNTPEAAALADGAGFLEGGDDPLDDAVVRDQVQLGGGVAREDARQLGDRPGLGLLDGVLDVVAR